MGKRSKLFIDNFLIYGFSRVIGKIIPIIMLPIITRLIPNTSIYGTADLLRVIISFGSAFALLGMYDAMFRTFFDNETIKHKKTVCSSSLNLVLKSSVITGLIIIIGSKLIARFVLGNGDYFGWVILTGVQIMVTSINSIISAPTRMQNKRKVFLMISIIGPLISYSIAIPVIIYIDPLAGLIFGGFISILVQLGFFYFLNKKWFCFNLIDKKISKEMLKIGLPLMPTFLIYWIFHSFDRIMISQMIGPAANGIYAVGAKLAMISQFIYAAFAGGWQYFAFSTMNDKDQVSLTSKVFEYLGSISLLSVIIISPWIKPVFQILFSVNYSKGFIVVPYLFLSPLLLMLFQTAGNQLLIIKKTLIITITLLFGALFNIILNYVLIPRLGIEGAAIATLAGYSLSVIIMSFIVVRKKLLIISSRFVFLVIVTVIFMIASRLYLNEFMITWILVAVSVVILFIILYKNEIIDVSKRFKWNQ
jgi:O-antigen/teichoic acid export membrane protein